MITSRLFFMWNYSGPCSSSVFVLGDAVASVGRLAFSFTDRRNSSLCKKLYVTFPSDTTGRSFKKQDDTRRSSNGPRTRTPPTDVITAWQAKPNLKTINFSEKRFSGKVTQLSIIQFFLCQVVLT